MGQAAFGGGEEAESNVIMSHIEIAASANEDLSHIYGTPVHGHFAGGSITSVAAVMTVAKTHSKSNIEADIDLCCK